MNIESKHVLVFSSVYSPGVKGGGPIRSLKEILDRAPSDIAILMVTADRDIGDRIPYAGLSSRIIGQGHHRIFYWNPRSFGSWLRLRNLLRARQYDLLYVNSLWSPLYTMLPCMLSFRVIRTKQLLIAPRGELSPGALGLKHAKKRLALATFGRLLAARSPLWHASNDLERSHILEHFPKAEVMVQANTSGPPPTRPEPSGETARFVFISRISAMKNLPFLLQALLSCRERLSLDIYGPLEDPDNWAECEKISKQLPANVTVRYRGVLSMDAVQPTFAKYDAFLFPTLGENFGHVVVESLASGCPVVCSTHTPWTNLLRQGCGTALEIDDPATWTQEIDIRAAQSARLRTTNKKLTTYQYSSWHDGQKATSPLATALTRAIL